MIEPNEIESRIRQAIPDAEVQVEDLTGGRDHYRVEVMSSRFAGLSLIERHRLVNGSLKDVLGGPLHALSISARAPGE